LEGQVKEKPRLTEHELADLLAGIGVDRLAGDLYAMHSELILALTYIYRSQNTGKRSNLNAATNGISCEVMFALWNLSRAEGSAVGVLPRELAKMAQLVIKERLERTRTVMALKEVLALGNHGTSASQIIRELRDDRRHSKHSTAIKSSLMAAAKALNVLGLVEMVPGTRGRQQKVTAAIRLSPLGMDVMRILVNNTISRCIDRYLEACCPEERKDK
jgi:hypothetical protein